MFPSASGCYRSPKRPRWHLKHDPTAVDGFAILFVHRFGDALNSHIHCHDCPLQCPRCGQAMKILAFILDKVPDDP